ncbi:MAG: hypothetical protein ACYDCG_19820 [Candidatus Acidiferrales bacterium]
MYTAKSSLLCLGTVLVITTCPSLLAQKRNLQVTSLSYRAVPWQNTTYYRTQGQSNTDCYGSGTDYGYGSAVSMNCTTTTTPSQMYPITISKMFIYDQVESDGMVYTITCTANWVGSNCSWLNPGDIFNAQIDGKTMWVGGARGGNRGKRIKIKYTIRDVREKPAEQAQPGTQATSATGVDTPAAPSTNSSSNSEDAVIVCLPGQTSVALKREPTKDSTAYINLACGTRVKVLMRSEGFATVLTADFYKGFVDSENLLAPGPSN